MKQKIEDIKKELAREEDFYKKDFEGHFSPTEAFAIGVSYGRFTVLRRQIERILWSSDGSTDGQE